MMRHRILSAYSMILLLAFLTTGFVFRAAVADEPPADPPFAAPGDVEDNANDDKSIREQTIYIPFKDLREVFEKEGRSVVLPYEKFEKLWRQAREKVEVPREAGPPVGALITEATSEATVEEDVVSVSAQLKVEVLAKGWTKVPLRLADAAIESAHIGDQPARVIRDNDGYSLLIRQEDEEPLPIDLKLVYSKAFTKAPGQNSVSFAAPQAPVNRWTIRIGEPGVKVNIQPLIAAAEVPEGDGAAAEETVMLAFVGAAPTVRIEWTPKAEGARGMKALATVQTEQVVEIDEGVMRTTAKVAYEISRAEVSTLVMQTPADHQVVSVFDPNVREWEVKKDGDVKTVEIQLFEPVRGKQDVTVELERFLDNLEGELKAPVVSAQNVGRRQGVVVVALSEGLAAEPTTRNGLSQVDAGNLPPTLQKKEWDFAYRYAALPFDLGLTVKRIEPRIEVAELVEAYIQPQQLTVDYTAVYDIQRAGVFQLEIALPEGFEVRDVRGRACSNASAAEIDSRDVIEATNTLQVNLKNKAIGKLALTITLWRRLDDPHLQRPTGEQSTFAMALPHVVRTGIEHASGRIVVLKPEALRLYPTKKEGLRSISIGEAFKDVASARGNRFSDLAPALTLAYASETPELEIAAERRPPYIAARQLLTASFEEGVVKYDCTINFEVKYSGVENLRIDVPEDLAKELRNETSAIRIEPWVDENADTDQPQAGYVARRLSQDGEFLGAATVRLTWEEQLEGELEVGKPVELSLPHLKPVGVDRAWGQVVVVKAETLDVRAAGRPDGLRQIDPRRDLADGADIPDAAAAFEFHDDWTLNLTATRYELEKIARTSVERAAIRLVATRAGQIRVQALYRMRSARQRLTVTLPQADQVEFDRQPVRINGRPVALEKGEAGQYLIPLVDQESEKPFLLELRYSLPGGPSRLDVPQFAEDAVIQKVYLCTYIPDEWALLGSTGQWTQEVSGPNDWRGTNQLPGRQMHRDGGNPAARLARWVAEDIDVVGDPVSGFQSDGRLYVYSTLQPSQPPEGTLRLVTWHRRWVSVAVFAIILGVGLVLTTRPLPHKLTGAAIVLMAAVTCGVFLPTLAIQLDRQAPVAAAAIFLTAVIWGIWYVFVLRRWWLAMSAPPAPSVTPSRTPSTQPKPTDAGIDLTSDDSSPDSPINAEPAPPDSSSDPPSNETEEQDNENRSEGGGDDEK